MPEAGHLRWLVRLVRGAWVEGGPVMGLPRGTVTFLFTDLEGSTARWEERPAEMAEALRSIPERLEKIGEAARTLAQEYSVGRMIDQTLAAYQDAQRSAASR